MADVLYFVVPCYNEEDVLPETSKRLLEKLEWLTSQGIVDEKSRILFVDDGSKDKTWEIIRGLHQKDVRFSGVKESRNRGHQNALLAGLYTAVNYADVTITLDADLQDDINAADGMLAAYNKGADVVYGVRSAREKDTFFKKFTAEGFYKVMKKMGVDVVFNHADYRLMSKRAVKGLFEFGETNLFLRGIVPMVGYPSDTVYYERAERFAGESKYPLKKMLSFALDGITSFSAKPLGMIASLGLALTALGFAGLIVTIVLLALSIIPAWGLLIAVMTFLTGIIVTSIGVVGIYVGKNYIETKARPRFIIEETLTDPSPTGDKTE
ncbi:MAG: glycosyltransferase family 2 protein [Clostridia bacterium]|nr:glycosyltransferase family 2 protein [Clostridia bacterium]